MKASQVIRERLEALGYEVLSSPRANPYWRSQGWRSAGTCCWSCTVLGAHGFPQDLLSWSTMAEVAKAPDARWDLTATTRHGSGVLGDWELDIKPET